MTDHLETAVAVKSTPVLISRAPNCSCRPYYRGGLSGNQLSRTLQFIDANTALKLTTATLATAVGLSKYHFGKAFKQSTGMTLHSYVLERRMRRSRELLADSDLPLAAVAHATGFANQSHFTALFSTRIGISPGAYRRSAKTFLASPGSKGEINL
jgi:transcriptional regulator GlxA family with amidase domain